jgi:hypothetical protein
MSICTTLGLQVIDSQGAICPPFVACNPEANEQIHRKTCAFTALP